MVDSASFDADSTMIKFKKLLFYIRRSKFFYLEIIFRAACYKNLYVMVRTLLDTLITIPEDFDVGISPEYGYAVK